ncbi:MAG: AI-2E family transporter [Erysipelotrichales bacterium]|nr:AI-2E family transporter [Erysipelotrichales bacterium]
MKFIKDESVIKNVLTYSLAGILIMLFYFCISDLQKVVDIFKEFVLILRPFIIGGVIAYLLRTPMNLIEYKFLIKLGLPDKIRHYIAVFLALVFGVFCIIVFIYILVPQLFESILVLFANLEAYIRNLEAIIIDLCGTFNIDVSEVLDVLVSKIPSTQELTSYAMNFMTTYLPNVLSTTVTVANGVIQLIVGVIVGVYVMMDIKGFSREFRRALYAFTSDRVANTVLYTLRLADRIFNDFIGGKILDSLIIGILCFIVMSILNWPFPLLISAIIGITNVIPFFGPFIGAVPGFLIVLVVEPITSIWFLIFILLLQQFDGNVLGPKILGDTIGLPAIWIIFAILVGQGLLGFTGMVIGVPLFALIYFLTKERIRDNLSRKNKVIE